MSNSSTSTGDSAANFTYYHYTPSLAAASVFLIVFGLSTILHCFQSLRARAWYMIPLVIGGTCETIGYIGRLMNCKESPNYKLPSYIVQSLLLLISPALMAASVYMVLRTIVTSVHGEARCPIPTKYLTLTFVLGDITSFMIQSTGAGLLPKADPSSQLAGKWIIVGGLAVQLFFFGYFMIVSVIFHKRLHNSPTAYSQTNEIPWRRNIWTLYAASLLIMIRSVFRVIEYGEGNDGYLLRAEVWFFVFDATLMANVMLLFNAVHPSSISTLVRAEEVGKDAPEMTNSVAYQEGGERV